MVERKSKGILNCWLEVCVGDHIEREMTRILCGIRIEHKTKNGEKKIVI